MNSKPVDTIGSGEHLTLPEPDPDNITVLTRNLPNTPILPWNHYDSPWSEPESEADNSEPDTENLEESDSAQASALEGVELDGELDTAHNTLPEVIAEDELDTAHNIIPEVIAEDDQRLSALLDPREETPTDELTG